jgi:predicted NBD/HSP70 family sugar kinase
MSGGQVGNSELISMVNSRLVLGAVRVMQPTYRAAVARQTGLKPATITMIVNALIGEGILRETAEPAPQGTARFGRPPLMLELNATYKRVLAIDLEPGRIRVALTDLLANVLVYREEVADRLAEPGPAMRAVVALAKQVLSGVRRTDVQGIGVSLPGLIDAERGVLISSTNLPKWRDVPVAEILAEGLKLPVRVERSLRLAAMYEKWSTPRLAEQTALVISVRAGIGMCLMHRGEVYAGKSGFDGEIGHTVIDIAGPVCECGNRGCLEAFIGGPAICEMAKAEMLAGRCAILERLVAGGEALSPELIYRAAAAGDADCSAIVRRIGRFLGIAVANMINLLDPHEIVIGGSIDIAGDQLLNAVREQVERSALPRSRQGVHIRLSTQQEKLPILGAAVLVAQGLFELPQLRHGTFDEHLGTGRAEAIDLEPTRSSATPKDRRRRRGEPNDAGLGTVGSRRTPTA